ncbi:MAG: hypothetical protein IJV33_00860 [Bacteroidaceae bacterium]|nr:hypothetical protein [Bacteroidaceae bacterium]
MSRLIAWHLPIPFRLDLHVNFVSAKMAHREPQKRSESDRLGGVTQTTHAV